MSTSTIYRRLAFLRAKLNAVESHLDSIDPTRLNASDAITPGLVARGNLLREIWALEDRLRETRLSNPAPVVI